MPGTDGVPEAVPLAADEQVLWTGRPRLSAAAPAALVGLVILVVGVGWATTPAAPPRLALAVAALSTLVGVAVPAAAVLALANTRYVLTDRAASVKRGVVGRSVTRAPLARVENSAYGQSVAGSLFGYGTVTLETAGGGVAFRRVDDPGAVRALVDEHARPGGPEGEDAIPGSPAAWRAVREEVRLLRAALES